MLPDVDYKAAKTRKAYPEEFNSNFSAELQQFHLYVHY